MIKWTLFLVVVLVLELHLWKARTEALVAKCCPRAETLVLEPSSGGELRCERRRRLEVTRQLVDLREVRIEGLPSCGETSHHQIQELLEEVKVVPEDNACLDLFHDFLVLVRCSGPTIPGSSTRPAPRIPRVRKCCPGLYEDGVCRELQQQEQAAAAVVALRSFAGNFGNVEFIDVYSSGGPPKCTSNGSALVDYKVAARDVYASVDDGGSGGSISVTIPVIIEGRIVAWRNVTADPATSCFDTVDDTAGDDSGSLVLRRCAEADYCESNTCVRKCCPEDKVGSSRCLDPAEFQEPPPPGVLAALRANATTGGALPSNYVGLLHGKPCKYQWSPNEDETWELNAMGELLIPGYAAYNHSVFCMETRNNTLYGDFELLPFICFEDDKPPPPPQESQSNWYKNAIGGGLSLLSSLFLLATLLVYACLPSLQNLHGKTLMCHVASLLCAYLCLAATNFSLQNNLSLTQADSASVCTYLAYAMIYSFDSTFLWLNVMCFDIWWTFGGMQGTVSVADKRRTERRRFLGYCCYAWTLALLLTGASAFFDSLGPVNKSIGRQRCWYSDESLSEVLLFFLPISVTLLVNTALFVSTSRRCGRVKAEIRQMMSKEHCKDPKTRKFHSDRSRLTLNIKLFIVMGVPWLLDNVPSYFNHYGQTPLWLQEVLYVADVINSLQGLWIFILFVLKPKVYHGLRKRLLQLQRRKDDSLQQSRSSNARLQQVSSGSGSGSSQLPRVNKCLSSSTLTSNFVVSSTAT